MAAKKEDRQSKLPGKSQSATDLRRELANQDLDGGLGGSKSHHEKSSSKRGNSYHSSSKRSPSHSRLSSGEENDHCHSIKKTSSEDKQPRGPERLSSMNERFSKNNFSGDLGGDHDEESSERGRRKDASSTHQNNNIMDSSGGSLGKSGLSAHTLRSTGDSTIDSTASYGARPLQQQEYPDGDDYDNGDESGWKRPKYRPNPWAVEGSPFANNIGGNTQGRLSG